jgi:glycosyltransferase involved in cell wall biosynthesis
MLITFLYDPALGGGAAQSVNSLAHQLVMRGYEVVVITSGPQKEISCRYEDGIKIISFLPPNLYWVYEKDEHPLWQKIIWQILDTWNPFVYRIVKHIIQEEKPTIVHFHKLRGFSPSVWKAAKDAGIHKLIQTCHDYETISPQGYLVGWIGKLAIENSFLLYPYQSIRRKASQNIHFLTTPGISLMSMLNRQKFFENASCFIVPNTHNLTENEILQNFPSKPDPETVPLKILFLGRVVIDKGIDILCQAVQKANEGGAKVELSIAGSGNLEKQLMETFAGDNSIHFCGYVKGENKKKLIRECDIVGIPSIFPETFCITAAEALAYGKPVLASPIGELTEIIQEGKTGFFSPAGDVDKLTEKIMEIVENKQWLSEMQNDCLESAKKYTPETITDQFLSIYEI